MPEAESMKLKLDESARKIDRLVTVLRRVAVTLRQYEYCRHACEDCSCTKDARAAMRDLELTGEIR